MVEKEESMQNKMIRKMLSNIKEWFSGKEIERIRVNNGRQIFWVSNPKKIKFWKGIAVQQSRVLLGLKDNVDMPGVKITKVVYRK